MTVAIGAICGYPTEPYVIVAADHMITTGDIEFEQPQPKMWQFNESCVALMYGISGAQAEIADEVQTAVTNNKLTFVKLIAGMYGRKLRDYIKGEAEADLLAPLGLTADDLTRKTSTVDDQLRQHLSHRMQNYYEGSGLADDLGGAIIAGVDGLGCHLFGVEHGHVTNYDLIGFCAKGGGERHASSQFMFSGYTRFWPFYDALSLTYSAKKRAEVAPGVGSQTDIVLISATNQPNIMHAQYNSPFVEGLDKIYKQTQERIEKEFRSQHESVKKYFDDLIAAYDQQAAGTKIQTEPTKEAAPPIPPRPKRGRKAPTPSRE